MSREPETWTKPAKWRRWHARLARATARGGGLTLKVNLDVRKMLTDPNYFKPSNGRWLRDMWHENRSRQRWIERRVLAAIERI